MTSGIKKQINVYDIVIYQDTYFCGFKRIGHLTMNSWNIHKATLDNSATRGKQ